MPQSKGITREGEMMKIEKQGFETIDEALQSTVELYGDDYFISVLGALGYDDKEINSICELTEEKEGYHKVVLILADKENLLYDGSELSRIHNLSQVRRHLKRLGWSPSFCRFSTNAIPATTIVYRRSINVGK